MNESETGSGLPGFDELFRRADALREPVSAVAVGGADETVIKALAEARTRGWIRPIVAGGKGQIEDVAESCGIDLAGFRVLDTDDPAVTAVSEVREGRAQILMKGQVATPDLMKAVFSREAGLRTGRVVAQMVLMEIVRDDRVFLLTDTGITPEPTSDQRGELIGHAIETAAALGASEPKIALMAATEKATEALPDSLDAAKLASQSWQPAIVEGPLSFDLAYAAGAATKKRLTSRVAGSADAMVFPDLTSANLTVKGIMYTADCRFGGVLCGTAAPVVFMSRADSIQTRLRSLALALSTM
ncbi:phosphate acyltransferase [Stratiformator vulcanicus]|uniref:Phosphate acetyltransferase n=1 Tax=Stratiformator vulcanicus TaxID=2527980 RepID=A0A517QYB0_9PLAN|nr:phosphate acyltransferase [Stratiformator vulcanicus]QDT36621.1 Phosphate acetyltransferase [Stratiformator vulcanicus]